MTQATIDPAAVNSDDTSVVWTPLGTGDEGIYLCTPHAIKEYNSKIGILLGFGPKAETIADVQFLGPDDQPLTLSPHVADDAHQCVACKGGEPTEGTYADDGYARDESGIRVPAGDDELSQTATTLSQLMSLLGAEDGLSGDDVPASGEINDGYGDPE